MSQTGEMMLATRPSGAMRRFGIRTIAVLAVLWLAVAGALAQSAVNLTIQEDKLAAEQTNLEALKTELAGPAPSAERLSEIEAALRLARTNLLNVAKEVDGAWKLNKKSLDQLGPPPAEDADPEPETIAEERKRLSDLQSRLDNLVRGSEAFAARAFGLINVVTGQRRDQFFDQLLSRQRLPLSAFLWQQAGGAIAGGADRVGTFLSAWYEERIKQETLARAMASLGLALVVAVFLFAFGRSRVRNFIDKVHDREPHSTAANMALAGSAVFANVVLAAIALEIVLAVLAGEGLIEQASAEVARRLAVAVIILVFAMTVRYRAIKWRLDLPGMPPAAVLAKPLGSTAILVIAIAFGVDLVLVEGADLIGAGLHFTFVQSFLIAMVMAAMLVLIAIAGKRRSSDPKLAGKSLIRRHVRLVLIAIAVVTIGVELLGYLAFGRYLVRTVIVLCALAALFTLLRASARDALRRLERRFFARTGEADGAEPHLMFAFWTSLIVDLVLVVLAALVVLKQVRFGPREVQDWVALGLQGFKIGSVTISLADIAAALVLFAILIVVTRFLQRTLEREILPQTRLDAGVANSLVRFTGYVGVIAAALLSVGAAGVDFTNLAIIAGALSVGVGFGLQSIVNNFVSGLILLFERPIKVGDWIVTGSGEGYVRKIGVRSTVIETFERTALIIPNSELMSQPVKNWTLGNRIGRIAIPVGVSYDSDPRQVHDILVGCAKAHPQTLEKPAAYVVFKGFGDSSLDFELRVYLRDIVQVIEVGNAIRFEIWDRLKEAGIEIPFPQTDLHIKEIDRLEEAMIGRATNREKPSAKRPATSKSAAKPPATKTAKVRRRRPRAAETDSADD